MKAHLPRSGGVDTVFLAPTSPGWRLPVCRTGTNYPKNKTNGLGQTLTLSRPEKLSNVVDRPGELGGVLLPLSSNALRLLLHAIHEAHAGAHQRQQLRAIHFSPALLDHREELKGHHERFCA